MIVVSFWTDPTYEAHAKKLIASLDKLGISHDIHGVPSRGDWQKNTLMKPRFIMDKLYQHSRPVLWVDADAVVTRPLDFFTAPTFDIAVYRWSPVSLFRGDDWHNKGHLWNGTAYFANTELSDLVLKAWDLECQEHPQRLDQKNLGSILRTVEEKHLLRCLRPEYCWIERIMRSRMKIARPVIVHEAVHMDLGKEKEDA